MSLLLVCSLGLARSPGTVLPAVPSVAPGGMTALPADPLAVARDRWQEGDANGVIALMEPFSKTRAARKDLTSVLMLLGKAHLKLHQPAAASSAFYKVRQRGGPVAEIATWYEANADLQRGRYSAAIKECNTYRKRWPRGPYAEECRILIGDARASEGNARSAASAYYGYLRNPANEGHKREEEIRLRTALATAKSSPDKGIPLLQHLALNHRFASTGMGAAKALKELHTAGHEEAVIPDDLASRMLLATSMRKSGWVAEAWAMFTALEEEAADDPAVARWVKLNRADFIKDTRHFDGHNQSLEVRYEQEAEDGKADPKLAWRIFDTWRKAGRWKKAATWGRRGLTDHEGAYHWRWKLDDVAWAEMLAGEWAQSHEHWLAAKKAGHGVRANARFYAGFTAYQAGKYKAAEKGLTHAITANPTWRTAGYYWRAKVRDAVGDHEGAAKDRDTASQRDITGWYRLLLDETPPETGGWAQRDGTWQGAEEPALLDRSAPLDTAQVSIGQWPTVTPIAQLSHDTRAGRDPPRVSTGWASLRWPLSAEDLPPAEATAAAVVVIDRQLPTGYIQGDHYDFDRGIQNLRALGNRHKSTWPRLAAAAPLAKAGLFNDSGPIVYQTMRQYKNSSMIANPSQRAKVGALKNQIEGWIPAAQAARDHHHAALAHWGTHKKADSDEDRTALLKLQYPIAHPRELWEHCARWDMDPFLVLAVMRKESAYGASAVSRTGAKGLMQFLTSTGAKVSALLDEPLYSPQKLFDPSVNLRYSVYYLKVLRDRFGGNFAVGVGGYNGGPHHMSRTHRSQLGDLPLDAFVEMIERREPRDYIKKVVGAYQRYATLYGPPGAKVILPERLTTDDPTKVDF